MYEKIKKIKWEITFIIVSIINLYLFPVIALHTMTGDKTDILMGMAFGFVPLGWFIISLLYGFATQKKFVVSCCASILCIPLLFIRIITGEVIYEKIYALFLILIPCFFITLTGTFVGGLLKKAVLHLRTKWARPGNNQSN